jgi:hypothetical protein
MEAEFEATKAAMTAKALYQHALSNQEMEAMLGTTQPGRGSISWMGEIVQKMHEAGADTAEITTSSVLKIQIGMNDDSDESN